MAELGADYSFARPTAAELVRAGVKSVGRYLATFGDGRAIEKAEYEALTAAGISVWFVREGAASGLLAGHAKGVSDAQIAVANLARLGLSGCVVYAAADWDVQNPQFAACDDYLRGFASVIGLVRTGIYGGLHYLNHAHSAGLASWFWQAGATSWNHRETPAMTVNIEQTTRTPPVPGTDHNFIYTTNHGQAGTIIPDLRKEEEMPRYIRNSDTGTIAIGTLGVFHVELPNPDYVTLVDGWKLWDRTQDLNLPGNVYDFVKSWAPVSIIAQNVAEIHATVTQPVLRDGAPISQALDNAATGTLVRNLATTGVPVDSAAVAAAVIAQLPASDASLTQEQVKQAVIDGVSALTIKATA